MIKLPGARSITPSSRVINDDVVIDDYELINDESSIGPRITDEIACSRKIDNDNVLLNRDFANSAPMDITRNVVCYLDEVFGSLMRRLSGCMDDNVKAFSHMGSIVDSILRYNNIHFETINVHEVKQEFNMPEPLWFTFNPHTLNLFVAKAWYETYVAINTNVPVLWQCGNVSIDRFNSTDQDPIVGPLDLAKIKCIIACDHVAQHIIHNYTMNCEQLSHSDIHDSWTRSGTTLHSMLDLTVYVNPESTSQTQAQSLSHGSNGIDDGNLWSLF